MATLSNEMRYTLAYSSSMGRDNVSRSISGLNIGTSAESTGPHGLQALTRFIPVLGSFTMGTLNSVRWIREQAVIL